MIERHARNHGFARQAIHEATHLDDAFAGALSAKDSAVHPGRTTASERRFTPERDLDAAESAAAAPVAADGTTPRPTAGGPGETPPGRDTPGGGGRDKPATGVVVKARPKTKKPSMYKVLMLNDDYTPMEFVVHVLEGIFHKSREEATQIMLHVHQRGVGVCGVFTYEVAETKVTQVIDYARKHQHPLQCTLEKE